MRSATVPGVVQRNKNISIIISTALGLLGTGLSRNERGIFVVIIPHVKILDSDWSRAMD